MSAALSITTPRSNARGSPRKGAAVKKKVAHLLQGRLFWHLRQGWLDLIGGFLAGSIVAGSCVFLSLTLTN
jgi:hypothetical protein